jgi:succinate-acetate transporter protein
MSAPSGPDRVRVVLRPVGTPLPLGFLGLVVATTGFSAVQLGWIPADQAAVVAAGVLVFTVPVQLLASAFGFLARDPVAGTGMGVLAGTWAAVGVTTLGAQPGAHSPGLGILLVTAAVAMLVPAASASGKLVAAAVMALSAVRFACTGIVQLTGSPDWTRIAGWTGVALALLALYAALAFELEDVFDRPLLPVLRRGAGAAAMEGDVERQVADVPHEAGVRLQL